MIHLSQLLLSPRSRQARAELANPYEMHRTLSRAFGDDPARWEEARLLFRIEEEVSVAGLTAVPVLVQSHVAPDWSHHTRLPDYLVAEKASARVKEVTPPTFQEGQHLSFRLRANPTVKRDGKRLGLYRDEEREGWMARKAGESGFRLLTLTQSDEGSVRCRTAAGQSAVFSSVRFDGILAVTDPELLLSAWEDGVGAGKGVGFGLLSLARVH